MKAGLTMLNGVLLLLLGGAVAAADPGGSAPAPAPAAAAVTASAPATAGASEASAVAPAAAGPLFCAASASQLRLPALAPVAPQATAITCGSCSSSYCVGQKPNASCYYLSGGTYHLAHCQLDSSCGDGSFYCECTNNAPP